MSRLDLPPYDTPLEPDDEGSELLVWLAAVMLLLALAYAGQAMRDTEPRQPAMNLTPSSETVVVVPMTAGPPVTTEVEAP